MHAMPIRRLLLCSVLATGTALAQDAPPIKPGLWQVHSERLVDDQKAPDPLEQVKNMPPEMRQQMEAMMRERGIDSSGGPGEMKLCMSRESLEEGRWQGDQKQCKTTITSRTASAWKWHSVCKTPNAESDGESIFHGPESYTVKSTTRIKMQGKTQNHQTTMEGKWLGADCGTLPAVKPQPAPVQ
jgi:Protein of unknown function (DUF3617)